jgi:hypothetical protein
MHEAQTWRQLLGIVTSDTKEKRRLIEELNITPITLLRWINGESEPRPHNLQRLITLLPQYREQLRALLYEEKGFSDFADTVQEDLALEIPAEFYSRVMVARASTSENLRFWSTCHLILQQALGQFDAERAGMSIWVVRCMPPSGPFHKVRSLRESVGLGTYPWSGNLEQTAMFLGAESLAGQAVTLCRPGVLQDIDEENALSPTSRMDFEKSEAVYPILYAGRIGGVLLVSSTQPHYFDVAAKNELLQRYTDLIALAFEPKDFYAPEQIALCIMPSHEEQKAYFANFRQLVAETMLHTNTHEQPLNNVQADALVWQRLEEELLQLPVMKNAL